MTGEQYFTYLAQNFRLILGNKRKQKTSF